MVANANQDITTHYGSHTTGRGDSSVGVLVIHPDCDMGNEDTNDVIPNDVIPNSQSCRICIMSPIVDLNDAFSKEGQLTENIIAGVDDSHCPIFEEKDLQLFWDARHKSLCYNDNGKLVSCRKCCKAFSPIDLVDATLGLKLEQNGLDCIPSNSSVHCYRKYSCSYS
jgi:hypothetical protein